MSGLPDRVFSPKLSIQWAWCMIKVTVENGSVLCVAELNGRFGVYLDTDSLIDLARDQNVVDNGFCAPFGREAISYFL